ncbi:hypothetical protein [Verrucomicrobium sp. BvORR106]|uniref:hypothetical protein n=1 Tax=Verrucomicrobium sp. BvORR106 TaxID=1403819 RepID=UPI002240EBDD|nr:hypothetical protein [Verrucomicrobium sp. BvORR106]
MSTAVIGLSMVTGASIILAHSTGFKLCGRPAIFNNRPITQKGSWTFHHVESPNLLVATDGSKHAVPGIAFMPDTPEMELEAMERDDPDHRSAFAASRRPFRFAADPSSPGGYLAEVRIEYSCGNTFFPEHLLPRRLPSHRVRDVTKALRNYVQVPYTSESGAWEVSVSRASTGPRPSGSEAH